MSFEISAPIHPCKTCKHEAESHHVISDSYGQYMYHEDLKEDVWVESPVDYSICEKCGDSEICEFEEMTNLEFLEWKSDDKDKCS